jgi:hypothetical protein
MDSDSYKKHRRQDLLGRLFACLIAVLIIALAFLIAGPAPSGF